MNGVGEVGTSLRVCMFITVGTSIFVYTDPQGCGGDLHVCVGDALLSVHGGARECHSSQLPPQQTSAQRYKPTCVRREDEEEQAALLPCVKAADKRPPWEQTGVLCAPCPGWTDAWIAWITQGVYQEQLQLAYAGYQCKH